MTLKWNLFLVSTATFGALALTHPMPEAKGATPTCSITFRDFSSDNIRSDGQGAYEDGSSGVSCQVGTSNTSNSNNIKLALAAEKKGATRTILGYFDPNAGGPLEGLNYGSYVTIQQVANMTPNTAMATNVHYLFNNGSYSLNWCGGLFGEGGCVTGSDAVWVSRVDAKTWIVTTDPQSDPRVGSLAGLTSTSGGTQTLYTMPFGFTISCSTCQWP